MRGRWPRNNPLTDGQSINIAKHSHLPVMPRLPLHALYTAANPTTGPALHARSPRRTACPPTAHQACGGSSRGTDGGGAATVPDKCGRHHHQRHRCRGVAKGTFYHYFQAKTDILLALRERFTQAFQQRIANAVEACPANDHPGRLRAWTESGLAGYLEGYRLHDVVYSEHHHHQRGNQERDRVLEQLAELLENGAAAGAAAAQPTAERPAALLRAAWRRRRRHRRRAAWIPSRWPANSPMPSCAARCQRLRQAQPQKVSCRWRQYSRPSSSRCRTTVDRRSLRPAASDWISR